MPIQKDEMAAENKPTQKFSSKMNPFQMTNFDNHQELEIDEEEIVLQENEAEHKEEDKNTSNIGSKSGKKKRNKKSKKAVEKQTEPKTSEIENKEQVQVPSKEYKIVKMRPKTALMDSEDEEEKVYEIIEEKPIPKQNQPTKKMEVEKKPEAKPKRQFMRAFDDFIINGIDEFLPINGVSLYNQKKRCRIWGNGAIGEFPINSSATEKLKIRKIEKLNGNVILDYLQVDQLEIVFPLGQKPIVNMIKLKETGNSQASFLCELSDPIRSAINLGKDEKKLIYGKYSRITENSSMLLYINEKNQLLQYNLADIRKKEPGHPRIVAEGVEDFVLDNGYPCYLNKKGEVCLRGSMASGDWTELGALWTCLLKLPDCWMIIGWLKADFKHIYVKLDQNGSIQSVYKISVHSRDPKSLSNFS